MTTSTTAPAAAAATIRLAGWDHVAILGVASVSEILPCWPTPVLLG
jgi:hypothetical protein